MPLMPSAPDLLQHSSVCLTPAQGALRTRDVEEQEVQVGGRRRETGASEDHIAEDGSSGVR